MATKIGSLYNAKNVLVGQAAGFFAAVNTPLPVGLGGDSITPFDTTVWNSDSVSVGAASAGTFTLTLAGGPPGTAVTTAAIAYNATATVVAAALQLVLPSVYVATVTGTGATATPWVVTIDGPGADDIVLSGVGTGLTGGTFSVALNAWSAAGATEQGWQFNYNPQTNAVQIEEQPTPVAENVSTAQFQFVANLAEDTVKSLMLALNATSTVTAPDTTHFGKTRLTMQTDLIHRAVVLETQNKYGMPRRYYIPDSTVAANVGMTFRRAAGARLVPVTFTSVCDFGSIIIDELTANHS